MAATKAPEGTRKESEKATFSTDSQPGQGDTEGNDRDQQEKEDAPTRSSKKRTKSGCLTCRKRRIKCDEARPICQNCIKSKRHCDGYYQRVLFKPANIDFRHFQNGATAITFPPGTLVMPMDLQALQQQSTSAGHSQLRPRPVPEYAPPPPPPRQPYSQPYHGSLLPQQNIHSNLVVNHDTFGHVPQPTNLYDPQQPQPMVLQQPFVPSPYELTLNGSMALPASDAAQHIPPTFQQPHPTATIANARRAPRVRLDQIAPPRVDSDSRTNSIFQMSPSRQAAPKPRDSMTSGM